MAWSFSSFLTSLFDFLPVVPFGGDVGALFRSEA